MTAPTHDNPVVANALSRVSRLATLPEVTTRILKIIDDPNATADQLESLVSGDPILSAKVLKVVNSSFYGIPATVGSIKQAIMMLGLGGLRSIALAASLSKLFGGAAAPGAFDPQGPWRHSAAVAAAAKMISERIGADGDEMFLAGLLHDVGTVIAMQALRQEFMALVEQRANTCAEEYEISERRLLGTTHEELGVALCESWNFPKPIRVAVEFHHHPEACELDCRQAAEIICLADHIASICGIGYCSTSADAELPQRVVESLGLSEDQCTEILALLPEASGLADQLAA